MKNKGFTLTEILAVLVIMGIVALIVFPVITSVIKKSEKDLYSDQVKIVENAAKSWHLENSTSDDQPGDKCYVSIDKLTGRYIENDEVIDPRDDSEMTGGVIITYTNNKYTYEYTDSLDDSILECK